jgi:SAM-dependent methyltransferase
MLPTLSLQSAEMILKLGPGERDLFTSASSGASYAMSLRHAKAYEFALKLAAGKSVLDLGCGAGNGAVYLSRIANMTGLDVQRDLIELLPSVWPASGVRRMHFPGGGLPFADACFDVVTSFQVNEHIRDQLSFLKKIRRVLRHSGVALITTPNRILRVGPFQEPWNPYHLRELTSWELRSLFRRAGFAPPQIYGLQGVRAFTAPERKRCLKQLIAPYWMVLPSWTRSMVRVSARHSVNAPKTPRSAGVESGPPARI